jgi:hypothetical protein
MKRKRVLCASLAYYCTLEMEAIRVSEMSENFYQTHGFTSQKVYDILFKEVPVSKLERKRILLFC